MEAILEQTAQDHIIDIFVNLGPVERIPLGEGREFKIDGELIAVFRARNGRLFATQALCPHRKGHLADGLIGGAKVVCPLHSFRFELDSGSAVGSDCAALKTYQVSINKSGDILLVL
jgi:nitrite reductase (NADH) small subunit